MEKCGGRHVYRDGGGDALARRNAGGVVLGAQRAACIDGGAVGCVNCGLRPRWQAGAYFKPRAAPAALRNRRLCKACRCQLAAARAPPEGKVERAAVVRPRAPPLHAPRTLVKCQCRVSVASRTLKLSVAQILRLQGDYFKLDN